MAASSGLLQRRAVQAGRPETEREGRGRPLLGILDRRGLLERSRHRQARLLLSLSIALVAAALAIASVGHAVLARQQLVIDKVQSQVQRTLQTEQNLQLERAQLETPARVLRIAESRYGMVAPQSVSYLKPVNPGESVLKAEQRRAGALQRTAR